MNSVRSYGYLWRSSEVGVFHYYGLGYGGQYLLVVPSLDLGIVATQARQVSGEETQQQKRAFPEQVFYPLLRAWPDLT